MTVLTDNTQHHDDDDVIITSNANNQSYCISSYLPSKQQQLQNNNNRRRRTVTTTAAQEEQEALKTTPVVMTRLLSAKNNNDNQANHGFPTLKSLLLSSFILVVSVVVLVLLFFQSTDSSLSSASAFARFKSAAVTVDAKECAFIGGDILKSKNGSAVDVAIATLFCLGLVIPESSGIGGGALFTIFDSSLKRVTVIDGRETAPSYSSPDMFTNYSSYYGVEAIAVPSEVAASFAAHSRFGRLSWREVIQPTIDLARKGFPVGHHLSNAIAQKWPEISKRDSHLARILTNHETGLPFREGEIMKRPDLAATLQVIADEGQDALYSPRGSLAPKVIADLKAKGSRLTLNDFLNYKVKVYENMIPRVVVGSKRTFKVFAPPLPASGHLLHFIIDVMTRLESKDDKEFYRHLVESWKFAYGQRSLLGDLDFEDDDSKEADDRLQDPAFAAKVASIIRSMTQTSVNASFYESFESFKEDSGTAALSVVDSQGSAVSVGATVNAYFGAMATSPSTGILLNNEMDDFVTSNDSSNSFGVKPSNHNRVLAAKRPLSSMCPVIVLNEEDKVILSLGASGGTQITSSASLIMLRVLLRGESLLDAVDASRLHHQLYPMNVKHEEDFPTDILADLRTFGHETQVIQGRGSIVMGISRSNDLLEAVSDFRKGGDVDGY